MSDPRNTVKFKGARSERETFIIDNSTITYDATKVGGSAVVGRAVTLSGNGTVALAADGDSILGRLEQVYVDLKAVVTTDGYVELPAGQSATVTAGKKIVGALGASSAKGFIRNVVSAGASPSQTEVNEIAAARHTIIDAATTTAVVVLLS